MGQREVPSWVQAVMFPANVTEMTIKLGFIMDPEHFQWEMELRNPADGTLLDLRSMPAGYVDRWGSCWFEIGWLVEQALVDHYGRNSRIGRAPSLRERLESLGVPPPRQADPFP